MSFQLPLIRVAAQDLAAVITEAANLAETAAAQDQHRGITRQEWDDAVRRLEAFRTQVAVTLGVSSREPDERLLDALREVIAVQRREWQCPNCQRWVPGVHLTCPDCTSDHATHDTPVAVADAELTGRFDPVPEPARCVAHGEQACGLCSLNLAECIADGGCSTYRDTGMHWDTCPNRVTKVTGAGAWVLLDDRVIGPPDNPPAHALTDDPAPLTAEQVADILSLVGVDVHSDHVRTAWTPQQWEQAAMWASAVHLSASDNGGVVIPPRPVFLPAPKPATQDAGSVNHG